MKFSGATPAWSGRPCLSVPSLPQRHQSASPAREKACGCGAFRSRKPPFFVLEAGSKHRTDIKAVRIKRLDGTSSRATSGEFGGACHSKFLGREDRTIPTLYRPMPARARTAPDHPCATPYREYSRAQKETCSPILNSQVECGKVSPFS